MNVRRAILISTSTCMVVHEHVTKEEFEEARRQRLGRPDVSKALAELKAEREQIEEALRRHERLGGQRPPNWMADVTPNRRGRTKSRPLGSNDPGSQPPPAAPA